MLQHKVSLITFASAAIGLRHNGSSRSQYIAMFVPYPHGHFASTLLWFCASLRLIQGIMSVSQKLDVHQLRAFFAREFLFE